MNNWRICERVNLNAPRCFPMRDAGAFIAGDDRAHEWIVEVMMGTQPADLTGYSAFAYVLRPDGTTVEFEAAIAAPNRIAATFPNACYALDGPCEATLRIVGPGGERVTVAALRYLCDLRTSDENVDPERTLVSVGEYIERAKEATDAANEAAEGANSAAGRAEEVAENLSDAADAANRAAQAATGAAGSATAAAGEASSAAEGARTATGQADAARQAAEEAAARAQAEAGAATAAAEEATRAADDAKTRTDEALAEAQRTLDSAVSDADEAVKKAVADAEAATGAATEAAGKANTAADGANVQANAAEQAAKSAGNAAGSAQSATEAAQEAARKALDAAERANNAASGTGFQKEVLDHLPEPSEMVENVLYLVPAADPNPDNVYEEYMLINGQRELIGSTAVDLSGYAKTEDVDAKLARKLDADATAKAAISATQDGAGNNINTTYVKSVTIEGTTVTITRGDGSTTEQTTQDTTYDQATALKLGLVRLYGEGGSASDGAMTQAAVTAALAEIRAAIGEQWHAKRFGFTATIPISGWSDGARPSVRVEVPGVLATDEPTVDVVLTGTADADDAILDAWSQIVDIETADDAIIVTATEVPKTAIPIHMKEVRNQ